MWHQFISDHVHQIPFLLAVRRSTDGVIMAGSKLNTSRILEGLLIAGVTGVIVMYGVQAKIEVEMAGIKEQHARMLQLIAEQKLDLQNQINREQDKLDRHIERGSK